MWYNFELAILLTGFEMKVRHDLKANIFPPRLILAGDIGRLMDYEAFCNLLSSVCATFTEVYLVLGNHEFFGVSHQEGLQLADKLQQEPRMIGRLIILNRKRVDIGDITLLGCTLWSDIPPEAAEIIQSKIKDFRRILGWTISSHNAEHAKDIKWLAESISSIRQTLAHGALPLQRI